MAKGFRKQKKAQSARREPPRIVKKRSAGEPPQEHVDGFPSWRFERVDSGFPSKGNWSTVDAGDLTEMFETLAYCENRPTNQMFFGHGGSRGHATRYDAEKISNKLSKEARNRLHELQLGEIDELIRIRCASLPRIYVWRGHGNVFNLLWWDPEHEVYPA